MYFTEPQQMQKPETPDILIQLGDYESKPQKKIKIIQDELKKNQTLGSRKDNYNNNKKFYY